MASERIQIGIFSDTHGWLDQELIDDFKDCDEIWHAGDLGNISVVEPWMKSGKLKAVYGNIDGTDVRAYFPEYLFFDVQGFPVLMIHIAGKHPSYNQTTRNLIRELKPRMLVCGHSHICRVVKEGGILYTNPGAAGRHGFHKMRTALKMVFENGKPIEVKVLELGKRTDLLTSEES
jgi:putative phosphoesterase